MDWYIPGPLPVTVTPATPSTPTPGAPRTTRLTSASDTRPGPRCSHALPRTNRFLASWCREPTPIRPLPLCPHPSCRGHSQPPRDQIQGLSSGLGFLSPEMEHGRWLPPPQCSPCGFWDATPSWVSTFIPAHAFSGSLALPVHLPDLPRPASRDLSSHLLHLLHATELQTHSHCLPCMCTQTFSNKSDVTGPKPGSQSSP